MDIKRTPLAVVLTASLTSGCIVNQVDNSAGFCKNGGSASQYSCEPDKQVPDAEPKTKLNEQDERWMKTRLAEIKTWLRSSAEKPAAQAATAANQPAQTGQAQLVRSPQATNPELVRIETLSKQGDHNAALAAINATLATNPDSLEALLTKSLVLNNLGQTDESIALLKNTASRYPSAPEIYNNLAVLYSEKGEQGKAIETLLQAFSTNPSYAQINQNLREVYASVASQAYSKALDLNESNKGPDLVMLRRTAQAGMPLEGDKLPEPVLTPDTATQVVSQQETQLKEAAEPLIIASISSATVDKQPSANVSLKDPDLEISEPSENQQTVSLSTSQAVTTQPEETASAVVEAVESKVEAAPEVAATPEVQAEVASEAAVVSEPEQVVTQPSQVEETAEKAAEMVTLEPTKTAQPSERELRDQAIQAAVNWAAAWSAQDINGYLNAYVDGFRPSSGLSNSGWKKQRHQRLTKPSYIEVTLDNIHSSVIDANTIAVSFNQRYRSNTYKDRTNKQLVMVRTGDTWKISKEQIK